MPTLVAAALIVAGLYLASCRVWPYTDCRPCRGTGTGPGSNGKRWRDCGRCGGSGKRLRFGARRRDR